jgi:hydroxymethylbilane synthase
MPDVVMKIVTRGSPLALAQAHMVQALLAQAHHCDPHSFEIVIIKTTGDLIQDRPLGEVGGKGLFTREIDQAMLKGEIDIAVHSSKDLPTQMPQGISVPGYLPREDVRDAFICASATNLMDLPQGAILGTASLRRQAQALRLRPDLQIVLLRGNVETRLRKAESGEVHATLLAYAGLKRLGLAQRATSLLPTDDFLPAIGQGAIGLTLRTDDHASQARVAPILDAATGYALAAERAFLTVLDGSCKTPIAGLAEVVGERLTFRGMVLRTDGSASYQIAREGAKEAGAALGQQAAEQILSDMPSDVLPYRMTH